MAPDDLLRFRCPCGRLLQVREALAGGLIRCPACFVVQWAPPRGIEEVVPLRDLLEVEPIDDAELLDG